MSITFAFQFNWSGDGVTWIDESVNIWGCDLRVGMPAPLASVAAIGTAALTLDNNTARYSPDNAASPLFGNLLPRRPMRITAIDGVTTWPIFSGYVDAIMPESGSFGGRLVKIACVDAIALLAFGRISLPLQIGQTADQLISQIVAQTYTPTATNYHVGSSPFDIAADAWTADHTAALSAIRECAESEFGRFFVQIDGTPTFLDRRYFFAPFTPALAINATSPATLTIGRDVASVFNVIKTVAHPRATLATIGVLAAARAPVLIPPVGPSGAGIRIVTLHFRDSAGGAIGGTNLQPLTAVTDYAINDRKDGGGSSYTTSPSFSIAVIDTRGSEITVQLSNNTPATLYATTLQVRGQAITTYDPLTQTQTDAASVTAYQKRT